MFVNTSPYPELEMNLINSFMIYVYSTTIE